MKLSLDARPFALLAALAIPACGGADPRDDAPAPASAGEDILIRLPPTIYACGTRITKGGTWHVFSDLTASGTTPCVSLNDVSGVTIDCHGHTITTGTQAGARAFEITNAGGTTIQNCRVKAAPGYADAVADFAFTYGALLQGDTFASDPTSGAQVNVHVADSTNFTAENSTFTMQLSQERSVGSTIASNAFTCLSTSCSSMVASSSGRSNVVRGNVIDGRAGFLYPSSFTRTDDGVLLIDESFATVSGNTIENVYDAGIEAVGSVTDSVWENNTMSYTQVCGFGGWYWLDFERNLVRDNRVSHAYEMFYFARIHGLRPANWYNAPRPAETQVAFDGNTFDGNVADATVTGLRKAGTLDVAVDAHGYLLDYDGQRASAAETVPAPAQFLVANNVFRGNDFGLYAPLFGEPPRAGAVVDGGGNACAKTAYADYPLACGRP